MHSTTRNTLALGLALSLAACGGGSDTPAPATTTAPAAPAAPTNPTTIALDAPALTVHTTASPRFTFVVAAAGEFQFDAGGMPKDIQLTILGSNGWTVTSDGDSGDGLDARLATFLAPATYTVRVHEYNHSAATAHVAVTAPAPFTAAASIAAGAPPTSVVSPAGSWDREASAEVALTVATPGSYRITSVASDSTACTPHITLIRDNAVVTSNSYGGPNNSALITQSLTAGTYTLRVRDSSYRACTHSVTIAAAP